MSASRQHPAMRGHTRIANRMGGTSGFQANVLGGQASGTREFRPMGGQRVELWMRKVAAPGR